MKQTISLMCDAWNCLSIKFLFALMDSNRVSCAHITPTLQPVLMFLTYLLAWVLKFIDLGGVGIDTWWSFWISNFAFFYICFLLSTKTLIRHGFIRHANQ
jgi:hypothetical protein